MSLKLLELCHLSLDGRRLLAVTNRYRRTSARPSAVLLTPRPLADVRRRFKYPPVHIALHRLQTRMLFSKSHSACDVALIAVTARSLETKQVAQRSRNYYRKELFHHSPGVIPGNHGKSESGWPDRGSNQSSPECESNGILFRGLAVGVRLSAGRKPRCRVQRRRIPTHARGLWCSLLDGATVAERLACSPPTMATRVQSLAGSLRIFAGGTHAERCHFSAGFSPGPPASPPFHPGAASITITAVGSQDPDVKRGPNIFTHYKGRNSCKETHIAASLVPTQASEGGNFADWTGRVRLACVHHSTASPTFISSRAGRGDREEELGEDSEASGHSLCFEPLQQSPGVISEKPNRNWEGICHDL
ncbi:hypothetical protein PR048_009960 [Dryococelus australis]|uniref:Uncharacterized protein n=1 Tax=Dryococelus australis TaxID=614101 RepID=A0ABQ9I244_9NEOP|nr:hypothetical protein PR048_009960 [Dryococelus australis]